MAERKLWANSVPYVMLCCVTSLSLKFILSLDRLIVPDQTVPYWNEPNRTKMNLNSIHPRPNMLRCPGDSYGNCLVCSFIIILCLPLHFILFLFLHLDFVSLCFLLSFNFMRLFKCVYIFILNAESTTIHDGFNKRRWWKFKSTKLNPVQTKISKTMHVELKLLFRLKLNLKKKNYANKNLTKINFKQVTQKRKSNIWKIYMQ